jgi:hypothetical protein
MQAPEAPVLAALISGAVSFLTGGVASYFIAKQKTLNDFRANFETGLRAERSKAYGRLWALTGILPKYARVEELTFQRLLAFATELRKWYFDELGGIVLSQNSRDAYFALQDEFELVHKERPNLDAPIDEPTRERIRQHCSALRTALCGDLGSRIPPLIGYSDQQGKKRV